MRTAPLTLALLLAAISARGLSGQINPAPEGAATEHVMDTAVARVHSKMIRAMGGDDGWKKARYFEFDFVPVREGTEAARLRQELCVDERA